MHTTASHKVTQGARTAVYERDEGSIGSEGVQEGTGSIYFLLAFSADLVTLLQTKRPLASTWDFEESKTDPLLPSVFSTDLMTPTATVWRMSRTAKRPRGGYSANDSTHCANSISSRRRRRRGN